MMMRFLQRATGASLMIAMLVWFVALGLALQARSAERDEITIRNSRTFEFTSKVNGHRYRINVALPFYRPPSGGYAVLYVIDGEWYFESAAEMVRIFGNPNRVVVVGIGYPEDSAYAKQVLMQRGAKQGPLPSYFGGMAPWQIAPYLERTYDLTLPASDAQLAVQTLPGTLKDRSANVGGLDSFLKVIEIDVKPRVAALAPIDLKNQALFGHSLGGLATLRALFVEAGAFRTFIVASPSIWWNNRAVLADEENFVAAVKGGRVHPRVLITVGGEESAIKEAPESWGLDQRQVNIFTRKNRMVENATELAARLNAIRGGPGYDVESAVFDKEEHTPSAWAALSRAIPFAFADDAVDR